MSELVDRATRTTARSTRGEKRLALVRASGVAGVTSPFDPPSDDRIEQVLGRRADPLDFCVTLVSGCTPGEVRRAFAGVPAPRHGGSRIRAGRVSVLSLAGGVVVVEDGGGAGTDAAVLRAASRWGRAASYHCSAAGLEVLGFAESGRLLDLGAYRLPDARPAHPRLSALVDEVVAATDDPLLLPVLVLERFVGMVIDSPIPGGPDLTEVRHRD